MAENPTQHSCCQECADQYVCYCLRVTEDMAVEAILNGANTFDDLRGLTDAGNGCTACHSKLRTLLEVFATEAAERDAKRRALATI